MGGVEKPLPCLAVLLRFLHALESAFSSRVDCALVDFLTADIGEIEDADIDDKLDDTHD